MSSIFQAIDTNDFDRINELITKGIDTKTLNTALAHACKMGSLKIVKFLIAAV